MTRQAIIAVAVGVIIVLGASAAFLYSKTQNTNESAATTVAQNESKSENASMSSIVDLLSKNENTKCTFSSSTDEGETSGTVYVSGDKARGEFEVMVGKEKTTTNMIRQGDTFYMWGDSFPTGMKMVMSVDEWAQKAEQPQTEEALSTFDPNYDVDFKCSNWTVDATLFDTPKDVKFISIEGMMNPTKTTTDDKTTETSEKTSTTDQCSICSALTGEAKNVCLEQFNCQ
jgi:hypothetical protein